MHSFFSTLGYDYISCLILNVNQQAYSKTNDLRPPLMPTKSGLKSGVVSRQELTSIIKCFLGLNEVVLSHRVVSRKDGLSSGVLLYFIFFPQIRNIFNVM